jgi:hypothetical protein
MQTNYGSFIRERAIKNLLSAQEKMANKENEKALIVLSKFILKISRQFDDEVLQVNFKQDNDGMMK